MYGYGYGYGYVVLNFPLSSLFTIICIEMHMLEWNWAGAWAKDRAHASVVSDRRIFHITICAWWHNNVQSEQELDQFVCVSVSVSVFFSSSFTFVIFSRHIVFGIVDISHFQRYDDAIYTHNCELLNVNLFRSSPSWMYIMFYIVVGFFVLFQLICRPESIS